MKKLFVFCFIIPLLAACDSASRRPAMLAVLDKADSLNRSYIPITSDILLREAVGYFDSHGTPNERIRAYYLLGCAYRDMGESPRAIEVWQDAIACADTLAVDCDHALLCRVYSQMAELFYRQNLMRDNLNCLDASVWHAKMAKDTVSAISSMAHKMSAFERMGMPDSVIAYYELTNDYCQKANINWLAARFAVLALDCYLKQEKYAKARTLMQLYEKESGYVDERGHVEKGCEIYYYYRGKYHLNVHEYDSAEMFFRRELCEGHDYNNQNAAAKGLAQLFSLTGKSDSAAKYALYSYAMNDSAYGQMATREVEQARGMYEYGRHQRNALAEKEKAERAYRLSYLLFAIISVIIIVAVFVFERLRLKRKATKKLLYEKARKLMQTQGELSFLRGKLLRLSDTVSDKNATIHQQEVAIESLSEIIARKEDELAASISELANVRNGFSLQEEKADETKRKLTASPAYQTLHDKDTRGEKLEAENWESISQLVKQTLPTFYAFVTAPQNRTNIKEQQLCLLFRLYVKPRRASLLIGVAPSMVTKLGKSALMKLFNADGTSKHLAEKLQMLR